MKKNGKGANAPALCFDLASTRLAKHISRDLNELRDMQLQNLSRSVTPYNVVSRYCSIQDAHTLKKFESLSEGENKNERQEKTYSKFADVIDHMGNFRSENLDLPPRNGRVQSTMRADWSILLRARAVAKQLLGTLTTEEWFRHCKNSKGSSIGVPYVDTSDERKFTAPISCTTRVKTLFDIYQVFDPQLKASIDELNSSSPGIPTGKRYNIVDGSRATTVCKNQDIDRFIAIEPTLNMFFQQGLMSVMYDRMKTLGLDLNSLPLLHQKLAMRSSITGEYATIDFSSASDCNSYDFMEWFLPSSWFHRVDRCRSPSITVEGEVVDLPIISTMGNAVTFPLETIVFWSIAHACLLHSTGTNSTLPEWDSLGEVSVFGDDCIVPTRIAKLFMSSCERVGFLVNKEKSFFDEKDRFRESCGGDYLAGIDFRPLYLGGAVSNSKSSIEPWLNTCLNKVILKYISYFGDLTYCYDKEAFRFLLGLYKQHGIRLKLVPSDFPDDAGVKFGDDFNRLLSCYVDVPRLSPIYTNLHGTLRFNFCRFVYRKKLRRCDSLRLALWQKMPTTSRVDVEQVAANFGQPSFNRPKRQKGGYVVGVSRSSHWTHVA